MLNFRGKEMVETHIKSIYVCSEKGKPMENPYWVQMLKGLGIKGDRYATGKGSYSRTPNRGKPGQCVRHVTFISVEQIQEGNNGLIKNVLRPFEEKDTRRNFVVAHGYNLNSLIEKEFFFGNVWFKGVEESIPCEIPGQMVYKRGFVNAFRSCGGLRAQVLTDGIIRVGDKGYF